METHLKQRTKEWYEFRKEHLGASDIAAIMGISPWKSAYRLWQEKTGKVEDSPPNTAMKRGVELEQKALETYQFVSDNILLDEKEIDLVQVYDDWDIASCSLDGMTIDKVVEVKVPSKMTIQLCKEGTIGDNYMMQVQWQMMITGKEKADFFCYSEDDFALLEVSEDKELQTKMLMGAKEFWHFVEHNIEPPYKKTGIDRDFSYNDDSKKNTQAQDWKEAKENLDKWKKLEEKRKAELLKDITIDTIFSTAKVKIICIEKKGVVDWKLLAKENDISKDTVELFRKDNVQYKSLTILN